MVDQPDLRDTVARIINSALSNASPDLVPLASVVRAKPSDEYVVDHMARDLYCDSFAVDCISDEDWESDTNRVAYTEQARATLAWMRSNPHIAIAAISETDSAPDASNLPVHRATSLTKAATHPNAVAPAASRTATTGRSATAGQPGRAR